MKNSVKKNLWWISPIVLFIPLACLLCSLSITTGEKIVIGCILFAIQFLIGAITGFVANRIKKIFFKVLWIIVGLFINAIFWIIALLFMAFCEPITEEEYNGRKESFREMVYNEFSEENHLDKVVGIQLPQYRIVDSECTYVTFWPAETEYNVNLKIHFPKGLPTSVWKEIREKASNNASNPLAEEWVKNEWSVSEETPGVVSYRYEDFANVGCSVTFESNCDTVYVTRYKW